MRRIQLLAVEDNYAGIHWLKMILDRMGLVYGLSVATDGEKAVDSPLKRNGFRQGARSGSHPARPQSAQTRRCYPHLRPVAEELSRV